MAATFIGKRKLIWQQLEKLLNHFGSSRNIRNLNRTQVRQLGNCYRRTVTDLAIVRVESRDQRLVSYLNNLVIRAHSLIYRHKIARMRFIWDFYRIDFPTVFRQTYIYPLTIFLLFSIITLLAFTATWRNDDFAEFAYLTTQTVLDIKEGHKWWESLNDGAPVGTIAIIFNNIGVTLKTFAFSIFPLIGTLYAVMPTALQFGAINALAIKYQMKLELWSFIAGHGVFEFAAIFVAGGAGLLLGTSLLIPGDYTRKDALFIQGVVAAKLLVGCIPFLILAGLIEGFISPISIHYYFKIAISIGSIICLIFYLLTKK
jgi:uncharacterized membrane protein SpoIIM required for sporulation